MCRARCTCFAKLTGAGPDHPLIGTVALFRMGKRVPVAEHHFRHPGAPRCGRGRHPALFRLLARRQMAGDPITWANLDQVAQTPTLAPDARPQCTQHVLPTSALHHRARVHVDEYSSGLVCVRERRTVDAETPQTQWHNGGRRRQGPIGP